MVEIYNIGQPRGETLKQNELDFVDMWNSLFDLNLLSEKQQEQFAFYAATNAFDICFHFHRCASLPEEYEEGFDSYEEEYDIHSTSTESTATEVWSQHDSDDEFNEIDFFVKDTSDQPPGDNSLPPFNFNPVYRARYLDNVYDAYGGIDLGLKYMYALNTNEGDTETFDCISSDTYNRMINFKPFNDRIFNVTAEYEQFEVDRQAEYKRLNNESPSSMLTIR